MDALVSAALVFAVLVGSTLQRVAGMGFGLVVAPFAWLLLSGQQGVVYTNSLSAIVRLVLLWPVRRLIDSRRLALLSTSGVAGAALGAGIAGMFDVDLFRIVMGSILVAGIVVSTLASRRMRATAPTASTSVLAGLATGILVASTGVGGPPLVVYSVMTRWDPRRFAATMQPFAVIIAGASTAAVLVASPSALPELPAVTWILSAAALLIGMCSGQLLDRLLDTRSATLVVLGLGLTGAIASILTGAISIAAGS